MSDKLHPFEKAGLGLAPFKFRFCETRVGPIHCADGITQIGSPGQPMGTCAYCGNGIALCMGIESSDGKRFIVGSDCVEKLYRPENQTTTEQARALARDPVYQAVKRAKADHNCKLRWAREAKRIAEGMEYLHTQADRLKATPHPTREGESMWDQLEWYMIHAGNKGKLDIIRRMRKLCEQPC